MRPSCIYKAWTGFYRKGIISKKEPLEIKYMIVEVEKTSTGALEDSVKYLYKRTKRLRKAKNVKKIR